MAIALPPPSAPQLSTVEAVQAGGSEIVTQSWQQDKVHVFGPELIDKALLEQAISSATDLSDVVRQIESAYFIAGYPAVQVRYARAEPELFVLVLPGKLTKVVVPEPYTAYFAGLEGADPLTDEKLERARTLASIHSDRKGENPTLEFQPEEAGTAMVLNGSESGPSQTSLGAEYGNPGNRFSGRHLMNYFARNGFETGDELRVEGRHSLTGLDKNSSPSESYYEHSLIWSRVTSVGLFGLRGRYVGYQQNVELDIGLGDRTDFSGNIRQAELAWVYPLAASFSSRWNLNSKLDYTRKNYEIRLLDETVQRQEYGSVEIGTDYARLFDVGGQRVDVTAGVAVRSGLGSDETDKPIRAADQGYLLFRPTLSVAAPVGESSVLGLSLVAQITDDTLPEQQQWVAGGLGNVEAFLPGVAAGDSGGLARLFAQTRIEVMGMPFVPQVFADYGYAKLENPFGEPFVPVAQSGATQTLADVGASLSVKVHRTTELRVSYAESLQEKNVTRRTQDASDANLFFSIAVTVP